MEFITEYPLGYMILIMAASAAISVWFYRKDNMLEGISRLWIVLLAFVRFVLFSLIGLFLLNPFLKYLVTEKQEPVIVVLQDQSSSLRFTADSAFYLNNYPQDFEEFVRSFDDRFEIQSFGFDGTMHEAIDFDYLGVYTNIQQALTEIDNRFVNRNIGAVVLATDGIQNRGSGVLKSGKYRFPIYTMALGDTTIRTDAAVARVRHNEVAILGNSFPLEITITAERMGGSKSRLRVVRGGKVLLDDEIVYNENSFSSTNAYQLPADNAGINKYEISLVPLGTEVNTTNNYATFYIDVLDSRQKVAVLAAAPHPDVSAIAKSLSSKETMEVTTFIADRYSGDFKDFSAIIIHQGTKTTNKVLLQRAVQSGKPLLWIVAPGDVLQDFNSLQSVVRITDSQGQSDVVQCAVNKNFTPFQLTDAQWSLLQTAPPVVSNFGNYALSAGAQVLAFQKVGNIQTSKPLILTADQSGTKSAYILGEGIWRWRVNDFRNTGTHKQFDELMNSLVQFISLNADKDRFVVRAPKYVDESEAVNFEAELYNTSFENIQEDVSVLLNLTNEAGEEYAYAFSESGIGFKARINALAPGEYEWQATASWRDERFTKRGKLVVRKIDLERMALTANHNLLFNISEQTGGAMFYPDEWNKLRDAIMQRDDLRPVIYERKNLSELINIRAILLLLLVLLAIEWFARKWLGTL
jgi:hypothetical protein